MDINTKIEGVTGAFNTESGKLIAICNEKYSDVDLCFKAGMNIPFASVELFTRDSASDKDATFKDATNLAKEIERRWNHRTVFSIASNYRSVTLITAEPSGERISQDKVTPHPTLSRREKYETIAKKIKAYGAIPPEYSPSKSELKQITKL